MNQRIDSYIKQIEAIQREVEEAIKNGKQYGLNADELLSEAEAMAKSTRHSTVECINFITEKEKRRRMTNYER